MGCDYTSFVFSRPILLYQQSGHGPKILVHEQRNVTEGISQPAERQNDGKETTVTHSDLQVPDNTENAWRWQYDKPVVESKQG